MINNVKMEQTDFVDFFKNGYVLGFEFEENILTIRNDENQTLAEIIYFEETNELLIMTEIEFIWCRRVTNIRCDKKSIYVDYEDMCGDFLYEDTISVDNL